MMLNNVKQPVTVDNIKDAYLWEIAASEYKTLSFINHPASNWHPVNRKYCGIIDFNLQDFQGRNLSSRAFEELHVQHTSDTYRTRIGLRLRYEPVRNYSISIRIEFFFLKIFLVSVIGILGEKQSLDELSVFS